MNIRSSCLVVAMTMTIVPAWCMEDHGGDGGHIMVVASEVKWKPAPTSLPAGAEAAVIEGDPTKEGPFTMRLKLPAGFRIPAHHHPGIEHVTVISGTLQMGVGDRYDEKQLKDLPVGSFAVMPIGTRHFAGCKDAAIVQIHGMGPWGITYVDEKDDPRKQAKQAK
jgi:quercetin dioxygenase-like cupin family protein